jgi:peroxiredoxin
MYELQGLQLRKADFDRRNTAILAVVVDPVEENAKVVRDVGLDYHVLSDPTLTAIDAYGLRHDQPGQPPIARPASFLIDAGGVIRWRDVTDNFRLRPKPDTILAAIDALGTGGS